MRWFEVVIKRGGNIDTDTFTMGEGSVRAYIVDDILDLQVGDTITVKRLTDTGQN